MIRQYRVLSQDNEDMGAFNAFDGHTAVKYMYMDLGYSANQTQVSDADDTDYDYSATAEGEETQYYKVHYLTEEEA